MIDLSGLVHTRPDYWEAEAAELHAVAAFTADFKRRHPRGEVLTQLEYMAATTRAPRRPGGLLYRRRPGLTAALAALAQDFRSNPDRPSSLHKCDARARGVRI